MGCVARTVRGLRMTINIPFPPATGNHYRSFTFKTRRDFVTKKAQAYRLAVKSCLVASRFAQSDMFVDHVNVVMNIYPPDRRKRDIDNVAKVVWDALTLAGLWKDDKLIKNLHVSVHEPFEGGYINLEVTDAISVSSCASA